MLSAKQIISILKIDGREVNDHATRLAAIYSFFAKERKNILSVTAEPEQLFFGRTGKDEREKEMVNNVMQYRTVHVIMNDGIEMMGQRLTVTTHRGKYSVVVPDQLADLFCEVLQVDAVGASTTSECHQNAGKLVSLRSFTIPAGFITSLKKARKFVSQDDLRENIKCVMIDIKDGMARAIATDCHQMFIGKTFPVQGESGEFKYLIPASDLKNFDAAGDFELVEYEGAKLGFLNSVYDLFTDGKFIDWRSVVPEYTKAVAFNRVKLIDKVKQTLPFTNKVTNRINFDFNGKISLEGSDLDLSKEYFTSMPYIRKELPDFQINFNGTILMNAMQTFDSPIVKMSSDGMPNKCAIFTDGTDEVLLMPLMNLND